MLPYETLPTTPEQLSEGTLIARLVDGIGFRYQLATNNFTQNEIDFCPISGSMNMLELLDHIYKLLVWTGTALQVDLKKKDSVSSFEDYRSETLLICKQISDHVGSLSNEEISKVTIYLKRTDTHYPFWFLINGPFSDRLTHIGQINSWRRISGNPVERISFFTGKGF